MQVLQLFLALFLSIVVVPGQQNLEICELVGDPHVFTFQLLNSGQRNRKECLNAHVLDAIRNEYAILTVTVNPGHLMVELNFQLFVPPSTNPFCRITSYNFTITKTPGCGNNGVIASSKSNSKFVELNVYYPAANMTFEVIHEKIYGPRHFNLFIWMPSSLVSRDRGACSVPGCVGPSSGIGKRAARSLQTVMDSANNISNQTAALICDTYVVSYLNAIGRSSSQRDAHYNETIAAARAVCLYDVSTIGASMATTALQMIMVEEQTTGITNVSDISAALFNMSTATSLLEQVINNTMPIIVGFLNGTNITSTWTTSSITTVTNANTSGFTTPSTSPMIQNSTATISTAARTSTSYGSTPELNAGSSKFSDIVYVIVFISGLWVLV